MLPKDIRREPFSPVTFLPCDRLVTKFDAQSGCGARAQTQSDCLGARSRRSSMSFSANPVRIGPSATGATCLAASCACTKWTVRAWSRWWARSALLRLRLASQVS